MIGRTGFIFSVFIILAIVSGCATTRDNVTDGFPEMRKIYTDGLSEGKSAVKTAIAGKMSKHPELGGALRPVIPIRRSEVVEWVWVPNRTNKVKDRFIEGHRIWYVRKHASWWKDKPLPGMVHVASLPKSYNIPFEHVNISGSHGSTPDTSITIPGDSLASGLVSTATNTTATPQRVIEQPPSGLPSNTAPASGAFQ